MYDVQRQLERSIFRSRLAHYQVKRPPSEPSSPVLSSDQLQPICTNLKTIAKNVQILSDRLTEKENQERIANEWRIVAVIFDRLFFLVYLIFNVVLLIAVFPRPEQT